jgi:uncharacterized membrane protein YdbT with pleckstrin-like domain
MPPNNPPSNQQPLTSKPASAPEPIPKIPEAAFLNRDEHIVTIVHRSFIGIVFIYLEAFAAVAALLALLFALAPDVFSGLSTQTNVLAMGIAVFAIALLFFVLFIATYIYRQSMLLVTDMNLVQILQKGLFVRKVSRLSMSNVEDVTAEQKGILPTIFNYGTLTVQTAGEMENFVFPYCPNPNKYADRILDARQAFVDKENEK